MAVILVSALSICKEVREARTQRAWAADDHAGACSNGMYVLVWNGRVEDISFQEPTRGLGMPRSLSIKQCVMWAVSLLRACFLKS